MEIGPDFRVRETICPAVAVAPEDKAASAYLVGAVVVEGGCTHFMLDLAQAARDLDERQSATFAGPEIILASPDVWLWRTRPSRHGVLHLWLPEGFSASVPFPPADAGGFIVDASTWAFLSTAVFGRFSSREVALAGARFDVVTLPGELTMVRSDVDRWLGAAADAVAAGSSVGSFPVPRVQVIIDPVLAGGVPFGMVQRGGGPQVLLLLGQRARVSDVVDDWVAVHELSHLLIPPVGLDDAWLGEGLASYHQSVLRARTGLMTDRVAWEALRDGIARGSEASRRGPFTTSLRDASRDMRRTGSFLQVYWGGAALALVLDVGLRQCAGVSIDDVAASFRREQPVLDVRRFPAAELVARAAARDPRCAHLQRDVDAGLDAPFPAVEALLRDLGVGSDGLEDGAPLAQIRRGITAPDANRR